jgi:fructose-1,6-bisphosphatase/inositol monophosphatase family enzyme
MNKRSSSIRRRSTISAELPRPQQRIEDVRRIHEAPGEVTAFLQRNDGCKIDICEYKNNRPTTSFDRKLDCLLRRVLVCPNEGWLSEESCDDLRRLGHERVWFVDPLDGTLEFIQGLPEWSVSIGLVEQGQAVASGVLNPSTGEILVGSIETGLVTAMMKQLRFEQRCCVSKPNGACVQRDPAVGVPQQLLKRLHVLSVRPQ